mmetsp:Transcript_150754/g.484534  ORF Transcript_150754/g.484534 Transcript_150754/m.484534 type:complete len:82 (+) Transcript_150754:204-449(+)
MQSWDRANLKCSAQTSVGEVLTEVASMRRTSRLIASAVPDKENLKCSDQTSMVDVAAQVVHVVVHPSTLCVATRLQPFFYD